MTSMELGQWAVPRLRELLPLEDSELKQIVSYSSNLPDTEAEEHLQNLLGESSSSLDFIAAFVKRRAASHVAPPAGPPPSNGLARASEPSLSSYDEAPKAQNGASPEQPPTYGETSTTIPLAGGWMPANLQSVAIAARHTNPVIEAGRIRAQDEQQMQQALQDLQYQYRIYNSDIEPEHETEYYCNCSVHQYQRLKWRRLPTQERWNRAVMYPGEKSYHDNPSGGPFQGGNAGLLFNGNPYQTRISMTPFGNRWLSGGYTDRWGVPIVRRPVPGCYTQWIRQVIALNNQLNQEAQMKINAKEPKEDIWAPKLPEGMEDLSLEDSASAAPEKSNGKVSEKGSSRRGSQAPNGKDKEKKSKFASFKKAMGVRSAEEKAEELANGLREAILAEEYGRWPDEQWRQIVAIYQDKVGMTRKIAELRARQPIQYLHLLRAGYFEPIPVAWALQASNPLKFTIESVVGWRGITPSWRGYEDLAEERLYWVLNHREGSMGTRMKPDFISEMNMAMERMAKAVEPPPLYYSPDDTFRQQHISTEYSRQVMPAPFRAYDRPETASDDTMILLDVSGSMDFNPVRPCYNEYFITGYTNSQQPKNRDLAKAIVRRFTDAMANHDHNSAGYDMVTFSDRATHIGTINHRNLARRWQNSVRFGGGTRVMTGWQEVKELHFQKHSASAIHHPVFGWQAGPDTPMLRLLLLLDGEATDMDEFELDLLGLSWAHVTIFLIGVDGCPHHHRHANELQRISDFNHHVSFVDAQGNTPERFVTHELLKRHLGYDISMREFEEMEQLPAYSEVA